ncbi:MAG TPA: nuclear transport factor 2 family protein [Nitrososphaerales archaeon]|nr:nuclear transport factor 2 family protein [Nitrososphaerales archaeon]
MKESYTEQELQNIALARRHIEGFANHNVEQALSVLTDDVIDEDLGEEPKHGKKEIEDEIRGYLKSFPDLHWEITNCFAHGDQVLIEIKARATRGPNALDGGKPGTQVEFYVSSIEHMSNGQIDHMRAYIIPIELSKKK